MSLAELWPLANHLWQSTLFAAVAGLLTLALRQNHARVRHAVWLAASCKFLIPIGVLIAIGGQIPWRPARQLAPSNLSIALDDVSQPFTSTAILPPLPATKQPAASPLPALLWSIWACGFLGIGCSWWVRWRRFRTAVRGGSPLELAVPIRVVSSPGLLEPGVFGVFRPVLLLPEGISGRLSPAQLQAVVAHELCHVRHRDNLIAAIHMFVETLFWFHPVVWWIGKRMVEERERACDEGVLSLGSEPRIYAEAILNVCKLYVESPLACVPGVTGANLKRRIEAIMTNRTGQKLNRGKKILLATAGVAVLAGPLAIGLCHGNVAEVSAAPLTPEPQPASFAVASVKTAVEPARELMFCIGPCTFGERLSVVGPRVDIRFMSLYNLIVAAYRINPYQLSGPDWMRSRRFDIAAKIPDGVSKDQVPEMLQALLAERFKLSIHRDNKEQPVFALVVGKNGPRLQVSAPEAGTPVPEPPGSRPLYTHYGDARQLENGDLVVTRGPYGPLRGGRGSSGAMKWEFLKLTVPALAAMLTPHLDRPVVDLTNLQGSYYLASENRPPSEEGVLTRKGGGPPEEGHLGADGRPPDPFGEGLFRAIEKAGLKLEARRAPVETIVVDRVEKVPTGN